MDLLDFALKYADSSSLWKRTAAHAAAAICRIQADFAEKRLNRLDLNIPVTPEAKAAMLKKIYSQTDESGKD